MSHFISKIDLSRFFFLSKQTNRQHLTHFVYFSEPTENSHLTTFSITAHAHDKRWRDGVITMDIFIWMIRWHDIDHSVYYIPFQVFPLTSEAISKGEKAEGFTFQANFTAILNAHFMSKLVRLLAPSFRSLRFLSL